MTGAVLASWNNGAAKAAILDFMERTTSDGPDFVPVADRIAAFDNDGTLWVEQPLPPQFDFVFRKWAEEVEADPSLASQQPYKAIIERDLAFFDGVATQDPGVIESLLKAFARSWAGTTPAEFDRQVREWLATVKQPKLGVLYKDLVYKPMLELFELLKDNGFRVFVCSGGGRDFMRVRYHVPGITYSEHWARAARPPPSSVSAQPAGPGPPGRPCRRRGPNSLDQVARTRSS